MTPRQFVLKENVKSEASVLFRTNCRDGVVHFWVSGCGGFWLGDGRSDSFCHNVSCGFEGIDDTTLTGQTGCWEDGPHHHCARLVAVRLS